MDSILFGRYPTRCFQSLIKKSRPRASVDEPVAGAAPPRAAACMVKK
jgi:hypothetical protein